MPGDQAVRRRGAAAARVCRPALAGLRGLGAGFVRQPVIVLLSFWIFALVRPTLVVLTGRSSGLDTILDFADHLVVALLLVCAMAVWKARAPSIRPVLWIPALGFALAGGLSAVLNRAGLLPMILGGWSGTTFWVLLFVASQVRWSLRDVERLERVLRWSVYAVVAGVVVNAVFPETFGHALSARGHKQTVYAGFLNLHSLFKTKSRLASFAGLGFAVYLARFVRTGEPRDRRLLLLCALCGLASLKLRVLLAFSAALGGVALAAPRAALRRLRGIALAGVGALTLGLIVGLTSGLGGTVLTPLGAEVRKFLTSGESVRSHLYMASFEMARANFPLGEGFGRFGSEASTRYYSPVYAEYGLSEIGGLREDDPVAAKDTTWATVLGETGWLGLTCFAGGVLALLGTALRRARARSAGPVPTRPQRRGPNPQLLLRAPEGSGISAAPGDAVPAWLDLAGVAVLASMLAQSLAEPSFFWLHTAPAVAMLIGASFSLRSADRPATPDPGRAAAPVGARRQGRRW